MQHDEVSSERLSSWWWCPLLHELRDDFLHGVVEGGLVANGAYPFHRLWHFPLFPDFREKIAELGGGEHEHVDVNCHVVEYEVFARATDPHVVPRSNHALWKTVKDNTRGYLHKFSDESPLLFHCIYQLQARSGYCDGKNLSCTVLHQHISLLPSYVLRYLPFCRHS